MNNCSEMLVNKEENNLSKNLPKTIAMRTVLFGDFFKY